MNSPIGSTYKNTPCNENNQESFRIVPLLSLSPAIVEDYWRALEDSNTLRFRLSDVVNPTWEDVVSMLQRMSNSMYMIFSKYEHPPVAEFMLENPTGRAMQSHFSTYPHISSEDRIKIGRFATRMLLTRRNPTDQEEYLLDTLYGLTPVSNRAACLFALKIGYVKQGILASGMFVDGKPEDCMISVCTRETLR